LTSEPCNELSNVSKTNGFLILSELKIAKDDLKSLLESSILNALSIKDQKIMEKNNSFLLTYTQQNRLPSTNFSATIDYDDMMGLIGEIVSEVHHRQCMEQDPVYVKWRETGTSKSKGLDIVFHKNDQLYSIECKHPHESLNNPDNDNIKIISRTVNRGFTSHDDHRTTEFMTKLYHRHLRQKRFLIGNHLDTTELDKKTTLLKRLIDNNNLVEEINLTADKIYQSSTLSEDLDSNLDFNRHVLVSKSLGIVLLLIENIHDLSEEVFSKHGN